MTLTLEFAENETVDLFLALNRDLQGRFPWEISLIPAPPSADIAAFRTAIEELQQNGVDEVPSWLVVDDPADLRAGHAGEALDQPARRLGAALLAARPFLAPRLSERDHERATARKTVSRLLPMERFDGVITEALGVSADRDLSLAVHLVPFAPHSPGAGFLTDRGRPTAAFVDCRRFAGPVLADCVLSLALWFLLMVAPGGRPGTPHKLTEVLAARLPGGTPYHRRLRAVLTKLLVEYTAGHLVRAESPEHRMCVDLLGSAWRYPRLYSVVERHWGAYLAGRITREDALTALCETIGALSPQWYVDHVDAASIAADFYLMEALISHGDDAARRLFARWVPQMASYFARQLDMIIGLELAHYERARDDRLPPHLKDFLVEVTTEASQVAWARTRNRLGQAKALTLAAEAFAGPGQEYGGRLWAPVAELLGRFALGEISDPVFVDQCFTMEHNNGSLFDKYLLTETMPGVLDAQAAGDFAILLTSASDRVRGLWRDHWGRRMAEHSPEWTGVRDAGAAPAEWPRLSWVGCSIRDAAPGDLGCGSPEPARLRGGSAIGAERLRTRDRTLRKPITLSLAHYRGARATLHTSLGVIEVALWPDIAPYSVDNFVKLARGERRWKHPETGQYSDGPYYDGTGFFRRIPGFLVQGGDRSETGRGGPGYRVPDELDARRPFDRPFLFAMSNLGTSSTGSQFFITLGPADHLSGRYNQCGEVLDEASRAVLRAIAVAPETPILERVEAVAW